MFLMSKILVVDDDLDILHVVEYLLTSDGFKVQTHSTGLMVNEVVSHFRPDLILLDVLLPGKLGTEICNEIKQLFDIPVILFSAHADLVGLFSICKPDAFMEKPFDIKKLMITIRSHLN